MLRCRKLNFIKFLCGTVIYFLLIAGPAGAFVELPVLDLQTIQPDDRMWGALGELNLKVTVLGITFDSGFTSLPPVSFLLKAQFDSSNSSGPAYEFVNGSFTAGGLLEGHFDSLALVDFGSGSGRFAADIQYTGGLLSGDLSAGRIEGVLNDLIGDVADKFTADRVTAVTGPVVPIPGALLLLGSGLLSLIGIRRFRKIST